MAPSPAPSPRRRGGHPVPALLAGALGAQRRHLMVAARGRVLDMGGASPGVPLSGLAATSFVVVDAASREVPSRIRSELGGRSRSGATVVGSLAELDGGERFDTVVGVAALAGASDPAADLERVRLLLRPGGMLALVEPYRRTGWRGRSGSLLAGPVLKRFGLRPDLAVVDLVRNAGFALASTERMTMPTLVAPLRWFVRVTAEQPSAAAADLADGAGVPV